MWIRIGREKQSRLRVTMVDCLPNACESSMSTINPMIATTITMTTTLGSLKLPLPTTTAAAMLR
jgi:hypothetical protein